MSQLRRLLMALSLLTCIPVAKYLPATWSERDLGASALYYPVVGILLSVLLLLVAGLFPEFASNWVVAIVLLVVWVMLTGALHLDGLADCVDALYAGHSVISHNTSDEPYPQKEKILTVLKDSNIGAMAAIVLVLALLSKWVLIAQLLPALSMALFAALVLSRLSALVLIVTTPYVRAGGLGKTLASYTPRKATLYITLAILLILFILFEITTVMVLAAVVAVILWFWRYIWLKAVGGFVGDTLGALIEITEIAVLLTLYILAL